MANTGWIHLPSNAEFHLLQVEELRIIIKPIQAGSQENKQYSNAIKAM